MARAAASIFATSSRCSASAAAFPPCIEAGSKVNWAALEADVVDKVFLYYAPENSGRHGISAHGRRHWPHEPHRRHSSPQHHSPSNSTGRIRSRSLHRKALKMFTGIVEELRTRRTTQARASSIACARVLDDLTIGASIAVNGVCLTAVDIRPDGFSADLAPETLERSNLGDLKSGDARQPGTPHHACRATERPHHAGPRRWHRHSRIAPRTRKQQLGTRGQSAARTRSLSGLQRLYRDRWHQPDDR